MIPKKIEKKFQEFGKERVDNYFWMRDQKDLDVLEYINHENKQTKNWFGDVKNFQEKIFKELKARKKDKDESVPYFYNEYWYVKKFEKGKEYPILFRKKGHLKARAEKIFDQNELAKGKKYYQIGSVNISPDNRYLAYTEDTNADKRYQIKIKDLHTGKNIKDSISRIVTSFEWSNDSKTILYVESDKTTLRPFRLVSHVIGEDTKKDTILFEEKNEIYYVHLSKTRSKQYFLINISSLDHEFYYYASADKSTLNFKIFTPGKPGIIYNINHGNGYWYILTNEKAIDSEIFTVKDDNISRKKWVSFVAPRNNVRYESFILFFGYVVYKEIIAGIPYFKIFNTATKKTRSVKFSSSLYGGDLLFNPEYHSKSFRLSFESMKDPEIEYECDLATGKLSVLKTNNPRGRYDKNTYRIERLWATSHDGVKIPISVIYKNNLIKNGNNPCILYGYGSYGHTLYQNFNENIFSLVDRGFVYAIAHIRGGQEMGRKWYLEGKFLKKKNTFLDFISCAEFLIKKKYTNSDKLVARGGSAGGLLMGAVANMRPDLFHAMVFAVPFVDVINTMMDSSIPLTVGEYVEWGNPNEKKYYNYMLSYSPYDNIKKQNYPTIFIDSGFNDTQVHYWEPLKYIAKMKEYKTDNNPILLHMDLGTGHGGKSGRFSSLEGVARTYVFILNMLGIKK